MCNLLQMTLAFFSMLVRQLDGAVCMELSARGIRCTVRNLCVLATHYPHYFLHIREVAKFAYEKRET